MHSTHTVIRLAQPADTDELAALRCLLWPEASLEEHRGELEAFFGGVAVSTLPTVLFVAVGEGVQGASALESREGVSLIGFLEAGLRSHADGCDPRQPVGFLEGWFVREEFRGLGVGRALVGAAEDWARAQGCREMASDTWIDHALSERAHRALGFEVVDRCIHFRKSLDVK